MNIEKYVKITKITALSVEHKGETIDFHIKPIMAVDQVVIANDFAKMVDSSKKDETGTAVMTGESLKLFAGINKKIAQFVMCDEAGKLLYKTYQEMLKAIPSKLLETIAEKIKEELEEPEDVAVVEKN